jgi:hypothetical protein
MRRTIKLVSIAGLTLTWGWADTISLSLVPSAEAVTLGQAVEVTVHISGLGTPPSVGAFDLNVRFDPSLLLPTPTPVSFGTLLGDPGAIPPQALTAFTLSVGVVEFAEVSLLAPSDLDSLQAMHGGSFDLSTLSFTALESGTASFSFSVGVVDDAFGNKLKVIPEPSALVLLGSALVAITLRRVKGLLTK